MAAAPGQTLRLFGESLAWDVGAANCPHVGGSARSTAAVTLVSKPSGVRTVLRPALASCYRLDVVLPAFMPLGLAEVWVNNGLYSSSAAGTRVLDEITIATAPLWPSRRWRYGTDCTNLTVCLSAASAAGGGVVMVPAGATINLSDGKALELGQRVQLVGSGQGSTLNWGSVTRPPDQPGAQGWVTGKERWQLRNIALTFPVGMAGVAAVHLPAGSVGCLVDNITVHAHAPAGAVLGAGIGFGFVKQGPATTRRRLRSSAAGSSSGIPALKQSQPNNSPVARHWSVTNSVFVQSATNESGCSAYWPHSDAFWMLSVSDGALRANTWHAACEGYNVDSSSRLFFADNNIVAAGAQYSEGNGFSHFSWPQVSEHIYIGNTSQTGNPAARIRQETMSFDGAPSLYYGQSRITGCEMYIPANPVRPEQNYSGLLVHIAAGTGVGQLRRVVSWKHSHRSSTWTLDAPLLTPLDETSYVSIGAYSGRITFEGNRFINGTQFQLFGTLEVISNNMDEIEDASVNFLEQFNEIKFLWEEELEASFEKFLSTGIDPREVFIASMKN